MWSYKIETIEFKDNGYEFEAEYEIWKKINLI